MGLTGGGTVLIEDDFIAYMFQIIEQLSDDVNDPYHYPVIRVVVCLRFMINTRARILISRLAHTKRTIHGLSPRPLPKPIFLTHHTSNKQSDQNSLRARLFLQDVRRKYHLTSKPRKRNLPPAPNPQAPLPPLHHPFHI